MEYSFIDMLLLMIGIYLILTVTKLDGQLKGIKYTLNQISKSVDTPESPINDELRDLINEGKDVKAVKKARETMGLSLVEGKQYVDALKLENK